MRSGLAEPLEDQMQELTMQEIDEISGANIFYDAGYYLARFAQWARVPKDEYTWVG
jgi:hypothetical protein